MNIDNFKSLNRYGQSLSREYGRAEPSFKAWLVFFYIGANPSCNITTLCNDLSLKHNTASKAVRMWARVDAHGNSGFDMIIGTIDHKFVEIRLNEKGLELCKALEVKA